MPESIDHRKDTKWLWIVGIIIIVTVLFIVIGNNGKEENQEGIFSSVSMSQEIKDFIEVSDKGPVTAETCRTYGGREIFPVDYEQLDSTQNERLFIIKENETKEMYKCVYFGEEEGLIVTMKSCCWKK